MKTKVWVLLIGAVVAVSACQKDNAVKPAAYRVTKVADGPDSTSLGFTGDEEHPKLPPH